MSVSGVALVCGAGSGIGRAVALAFAARGVRHLICADIELENAKETANQARQIGQDHSLKEATAFLVDVRQEADVQGLFEKAKAQAGRIDICVNTAGFGAGAPKPIRDMPIEDYRAQVEVHNIGGFLFLRTALKALAEQDLQAPEGSRYPVKGSVVLLTSLASEGAFIGVGNYTAAKFAVKGLVQTAALENASQGIRINAVAPSYVSGGMMDTFLEQSPPLKKQMLGDLPMGRLVDPEEVADAVLFLASPSSSYINGHTLVVDGGASLQLANTPFSSS